MRFFARWLHRSNEPLRPASAAQAHIVRLRDGRHAALRQAEPNDLEALREFFQELSPESRRQRFHVTTGGISDNVLYAWLNAPLARHGALLAFAAEHSERGPSIIAEARYDRLPGTDLAEFAVTVAERWRRLGLATALISAIALRARRAGIERLCGSALIENQPARFLMRALGARSAYGVDSAGTVQLCLAISDW